MRSKQQMGHVWLGFGDDQLRRLLGTAGFATPASFRCPWIRKRKARRCCSVGGEIDSPQLAVRS